MLKITQHADTIPHIFCSSSKPSVTLFSQTYNKVQISTLLVNACSFFRHIGDRAQHIIGGDCRRRRYPDRVHSGARELLSPQCAGVGLASARASCCHFNIAGAYMASMDGSCCHFNVLVLSLYQCTESAFAPIRGSW